MREHPHSRRPILDELEQLRRSRRSCGTCWASTASWGGCTWCRRTRWPASGASRPGATPARTSRRAGSSSRTSASRNRCWLACRHILSRFPARLCHRRHKPHGCPVLYDLYGNLALRGLRTHASLQPGAAHRVNHRQHAAFRLLRRFSIAEHDEALLTRCLRRTDRGHVERAADGRQAAVGVPLRPVVPQIFAQVQVGEPDRGDWCAVMPWPSHFPLTMPRTCSFGR